MNERDSKDPTVSPADRTLSDEEMTRYERQLILPEIGLKGQRLLKEASVLIVGAGGLGSAAAFYLAAAGVGRLGVADSDTVELSNLQRQILHSTSDIGRPKVTSAAKTVSALNPNVEVICHEVGLTENNANEIIRDYDIVLDGTDNYAARYLMNDACYLLGLPVVYGAVFGLEGHVSVFDSSRGPCYRCLYPEPPPPELVPDSTATGVLGVIPGVIGTLQAAEAIKLILGKGQPLLGRLLVFDALSTRFRELQVVKDPACVLCSVSREP